MSRPLDPNTRSLDEAKAQLLSLLQQQEEFTPAFYRDLALYLQVLRDGLLHSVQQACFHLATQVVPERYNQLTPERRQTFQRRLQSLVKRSCSLLTVEQVMERFGVSRHVVYYWIERGHVERRDVGRQDEYRRALVELPHHDAQRRFGRHARVHDGDVPDAIAHQLVEARCNDPSTGSG